MRAFSHPPLLPSAAPFCAILYATPNENRSGFFPYLCLRLTVRRYVLVETRRHVYQSRDKKKHNDRDPNEDPVGHQKVALI